MMKKHALSLIVIGLAFYGCGSDEKNNSTVDGGVSTRYYATMPLVIDPQMQNGVFHFGPHHIAADNNMVAFHMDWFPIPWRELASGAPPPAAWTAEMDAIGQLKEQLGMPVFLALTPVTPRDRLSGQATGATFLAAEDFDTKCQPVMSRPDYQTVVLPGYQAYVEEMIRRFQPRFVALGIEINMYTDNCPEAWPDLKGMLNQTYETVKAAHPELTVFHTFQVEFLWRAEIPPMACFGYTRDCLTTSMAPLADLKTDLFAMSVYPDASFYYNGRSLPDDYLSVFSTLQSAPLAIAEGGFVAAPTNFLIQETCIDDLPGSSADQQMWMRRLLADAERLNMPFVTWWADRSPVPEAELTPCPCSDSSAWCTFLKGIGLQAMLNIRYFAFQSLRTYDGTPRPALADWTAAVAGTR